MERQRTPVGPIINFDEATIREYIRNQQPEDARLDDNEMFLATNAPLRAVHLIKPPALPDDICFFSLVRRCSKSHNFIGELADHHDDTWN